MRLRPSLRRTLLVASFLIGLFASLMVFAQDRLFDADSFSTTAASTLTEPAVNDYLAKLISDALIVEVPDLAIGGPLLEEVTGSVLQSGPALRVVETATSEAHRAVFTDGEDTLVLEVSDLVVSIDQALRAIDPELAEAIPDELTSLSIDLSSGELSTTTVRIAEDLRALTIVLVVLAVLAFTTVVAMASSLFRGLASMGFVLGLIGLFLVVLEAVGEVALASYGQSELETNALVGIWNVVFGDLRNWGWVLILCGAFLAGLGWAVLHTGRIREDMVALFRRIAADPQTPAAQLARGGGALLVAGWALASPLSLLSAAIRIAGFALMIVVVARLVDETGIGRRLSRLAPEESDVVPLRSAMLRAATSVCLLLFLGVVGAVLLSRDDDASAFADPAACNGHVELCDRRLDEVTMAASHNAMSSTATDFYLPNHLSTMRAQLDHGVRAFMIDTLYGQPASDGTVRTSFDPVDITTLDAAAATAAEAVRARQDADLGARSVYLCHGFCEIGAIDAVDELRIVRQWLDDHPREVVVFIVQDATDPTDTAAVFEQAGFAEMLLTQRIDEPFPTLEEMIDSNRRVFVMVEEDGSGVEWLHPAFEFSQETPFSFAAADEFTCTMNRGSAGSPLFVINHFITLARPSNQSINDAEILLTRAEACSQERGRLPNLLAVDYVTRGDVMSVVDELNGVG